jgi:hypothetical protein
LKGFYERVGALLDEATAKVPHRAVPLAMSINLAQRTKDPKRMGESIDRLLSLGWPGDDEYFRREARSQAEKLAKILREEGRGSEADALLAALPAAEARDVFVRLSWDGDADYDLVVQEPLGAMAQFSAPRTVFGGSIIKNGYGKNAEEIYVCPRGFDGEYKIHIVTVYASDKKPPSRLTLETVVHEGTNGEHKETYALVPNDPQAKPVVVTLKGGRRKTVLPFLSPQAMLDAMAPPPSEKRKPAQRKGDRTSSTSAIAAPKASRSGSGDGPPKR